MNLDSKRILHSQINREHIGQVFSLRPPQPILIFWLLLHASTRQMICKDYDRYVALCCVRCGSARLERNLISKINNWFYKIPQLSPTQLPFENRIRKKSVMVQPCEIHHETRRRAFRILWREHRTSWYENPNILINRMWLPNLVMTRWINQSPSMNSAHHGESLNKIVGGNHSSQKAAPYLYFFLKIYLVIQILYLINPVSIPSLGRL